MAKAERQEKAKAMKGNNVQLLQRVHVLNLPDGWAKMNPERRAEFLGVAAESAEHDIAYIPAASENEGIRSGQDAVEWMKENNFVGTVRAFCCRNWGVDKDGRYTRAEQKVFSIS